MTTITAAIANPTTLSMDALGRALDVLVPRMGTAANRSALTRAENRVARITDEIARRGLVFVQSYDGGYMVGHAQDFAPCSR